MAADHGGGLLDPETLTALAPTAMMAGAMMLPMIASALAGLGGGGSGSGSGGSGGESGESGGLSPEAQKAVEVLKQLKDVYGSGGTGGSGGSSGSGTPTGGKKLGSTTTSGSTASGATATKLRAHQLYQRNAATAFNNLDNDLVNYMRSMAGNHKIDKKAVIALLREVDTQLAEIGSAAYTKAGQQKVHQILTNALAKAAKIVSGGNAAATGTAAEINRLTNQYIYNLAGREYQAASSSGATGTTAAVGGTVGQWIQQALQVLQQMGYDISKIDPEAIAIIIHYESGGNPNAMNLTDSNADNGTPSIGLMQTIGPTFNQWAVQGHTNIRNPVDNIVAGVRYAINRYGSVQNVPGVVAVRNGRPYEPY
ncbi:DUF4226 domain-containing protein [Nocardia sp. CA-129566]|uniref:DUF4226 domain-containing protein n=1 Tax=Nocardia sp. CA-129566 TaxID=3239976 RepID=UPI003D9600FE